MDLLGFARGLRSKWRWSFSVWGWRGASSALRLLRIRRDWNKPRVSILGYLWGGAATVATRSMPHPEFIARTGPGEALGYSYHLGLFAVVLLFTPHIIFIGSLFGFLWPGCRAASSP